MSDTQNLVDKFYQVTMEGRPCCAGCDSWEWINSVVGDCKKSAPVSAEQRMSMLSMHGLSIRADAGHILTKRDHSCGEFSDSYDWSAHVWPVNRRAFL